MFCGISLHGRKTERRGPAGDGGHPGHGWGQTPAMSGSGIVAQVPSSQEARYLAWSSVSLSISTPIVSSFRRAISLSISSGTT
jgi:hypothetical protein